jgi:hypothetical protein
MKFCCVVVGCLLLCATAGAQQRDAAAREPLRAGRVEARTRAGQPPAQEPPSLNDAQKSAIRALQSDSEQKSAQTATQLAGIVQKIYENNLSDTPNEELRVSLDNQMRELVWQMVAIKGNSMWTAFRMLTPEQKQLVRAEIVKPRPTGDLPDVLDLIIRTFQVTAR